jgi:potassium-transporting ATPase KdpC subunit
VTASGSGLDPDISPEAALYQAERVALARGLAIETIHALIERQTNRSGTLIGAPPRVNVLLLNLALDKEQSTLKMAVDKEQGNSR